MFSFFDSAAQKFNAASVFGNSCHWIFIFETRFSLRQDFITAREKQKKDAAER
jgi:hypothetical protein